MGERLTYSVDRDEDRGWAVRLHLAKYGRVLTLSREDLPLLREALLTAFGGTALDGRDVASGSSSFPVDNYDQVVS